MKETNLIQSMTNIKKIRSFNNSLFADAKEKHAMRYTPYRGLSQVTNWVRLKFATMNLKKYAVHRWKRLNVPQPSADFSLFSNFLFYFNFKTLKLS